MKITVKSLKGGSSVIEVNENTSVLDIKKSIEADIKIPVSQQTLVLFGKTLQDDKTVGYYPKIKDGTKLFVAMKKPDSLQAALTKVLKSYYSDDQCKLIVNEFMKNFHRYATSLSLDDLERIAKADTVD